MRRARTTRFSPALLLALLAWFAQLCLPAAHAAMMGAPRGDMPGWCGSPSAAQVAAATLPPEIRAALGLDGAAGDHLADCEKLCATGFTPPVSLVTVTVALRAAGLEPAPAAAPAPRSREPAPKPPSHGPPLHAR